MRQCKKCSIVKNYSEFVKNKRCALGITWRCNQCAANDSAKWRAVNPEKRKNIKRKYNNNPDNRVKLNIQRRAYYHRRKPKKDPKYSRQWYLKNKERVTEMRKLRHSSDPKKALIYKAARRARMANAAPKWLTKDHKKRIAEIYNNCPKGYHVDHIIPIHGKVVSGLHVPWNLQYLPAEDNLRKGNRFNSIEIL